MQVSCREILISFGGCEEQKLPTIGYVNGTRIESLEKINNPLSRDDERTLTLVCEDAAQLKVVRNDPLTVRIFLELKINGGSELFGDRNTQEVELGSTEIPY